MSYIGRHRAPNTGSVAKRAAIVGVVAAVPFVGVTGVAQANGIEDAIIQCESGGNPTAQNASSSASGLYQFIDSTWRAYGGGQFATRAKNATPAEQGQVFDRAFAAEGTRPWNASRSCWSGRQEATVAVASAPSTPSAWSTRWADRAPDGTGSYVCDDAHLYFEACDPGNLGETVSYPLYS